MSRTLATLCPIQPPKVSFYPSFFSLFRFYISLVHAYGRYSTRPPLREARGTRRKMYICRFRATIVVDDTVSMALVVGIFALVLCSVSAYCRTVASGAVNPLALILFAADQGRAASMLRA